tara:strand:- start:172 stop:609 length:438 start_codon:yes stop_codon:yes gene_type:complete
MKKLLMLTVLISAPLLGYAQEIPLPDDIKSLEENYPFIIPVTTIINQVQNQVVPVIQKEKDNAKQKQDQFDVLVNPDDDGSEVIPPLKENHEIKYWMWTIYGWILTLGIWLFTTSYGIAIVVFIVLYFLVKILIRLFRPRNRIIS